MTGLSWLGRIGKGTAAQLLLTASALLMAAGTLLVAIDDTGVAYLALIAGLLTAAVAPLLLLRPGPPRR